MRFRRPPRLATWLLDRLGYTRHNAALAGDLLEEFEQGRSRAWFWRQALMVVVSGAGRNAVRMRPYLGALVVGYAVQLPIAYLLWQLHAPSRVHGVGLEVGAGLAVLAGFVLLAEAQRLVVGSYATAPRLLVEAATGFARRRATAWISFETFSTYLLSYCLCALFFNRFSLEELVGGEAGLLMLTMSPLLRAPAVRREPTPTLSLGEWPPQELSLPVKLADGRTIVLEPDNAARSAFAAADGELIVALFGDAARREGLHRAVWLACARHYQKSLADSEARSAMTVRELGESMRHPSGRG